VIYVHEIRIEVQVLVTAHLDRGVRGLLGDGARREGHLGEEPVGRQRHAGDGTSGKLSGRGDKNLLDLGMRGPGPVGSERCH
jgi:hypothetical protein